MFVHPTSIVSDGATLGEGCRIWHHCHVMEGARLGRDVVLGQNGFVASGVVVGDGCRIQNNVSLYDGVILGDGVFVGPSAVFTNVKRPRARFPRKDSFETTRVGEGATIGANATIVCGVTIGRCAFIGAGAVVTRDVAEFAVVTGAPGHHVGWVCRCGERLVFDGEDEDGRDEGPGRCASCDREYEARDGAVIEVESHG